jgi:hypothetical protein
VKFDKVSTDQGIFYLGDSGHTVFAIVLHPADWRPKNEYFHEVGYVIASRLRGERPKPSSVSEEAGSRALVGTMTNKKPNPGLEPVAARRGPCAVQSAKGNVDNTPPAPTFQVGELVTYPIFGGGAVISSQPRGNDQLVTVAFQVVGVKKVLAGVARLERI